MLDYLRNASKTLAAKLLLLLLIASFGVWGVSTSMVSSPSNAVVTVGDQIVTPQEFRFAYQRRLVELSRQFGTRLTAAQAKAFGIDRQIFSQFAASAALDELAAKMRLGLSQDRLATLIAQDPAFKSVNGKFNRNLFRERLRGAGFGEDDYIRERSKAAVRGQIIAAVSDGFAPPRILVDALTQYRNEQRSLDYILLSNANIDPVKAPAEDVLNAWFDANKSRYRAPQMRKFTYVKLEPVDIADPATITEGQIKDYYDRHHDSFRTAGRRTVEQLTFSSKEMAEAAAKQIREGATSFDQVVADQGKTPSDVLLGEVTRDAIPDAAVANAAFAVQRDGVLSPVVEGAFGPVLLRVTAIRQESVMTLDEAAGTIRKELANNVAVQDIANVRDRFEDLRGGGASLADAAKELKLKTVTVEAIDRNGLDNKGLAVNGLPTPALLTEVFETELGAEAMPVAIGREGYVWFTVDQLMAERDRTLDEVKDEAVADWTNEQQHAGLDAKTVALKERLAKGEPLTAIAGEMGLPIETKLGLRRDGEDAIFGQQALAAIFSGAKGIIGAVRDNDGSSRILFTVKAVDQAAPAGGPDNDTQKTMAMAQAAGDDILNQMVNWLESDYSVKIDQAAADRAMTAY